MGKSFFPEDPISRIITCFPWFNHRSPLCLEFNLTYFSACWAASGLTCSSGRDQLFSGLKSYIFSSIQYPSVSKEAGCINSLRDLDMTGLLLVSSSSGHPVSTDHHPRIWACGHRPEWFWEQLFHSERRGLISDCRKEHETRNQENSICHKEHCVFGKMTSCVGLSVSFVFAISLWFFHSKCIEHLLNDATVAGAVVGSHNRPSPVVMEF